VKQLIPQIHSILLNIEERHFGSDQHQFKDLDLKGLNQLVTDMDVQVERELVDALHKLLPEAGFLTEEDTADQTKQNTRWIIDPIDGTTNFVHGIPAYCISIGLEIDDRIELGVVFELNRGEFFHAVRGNGAFLGSEKIKVSKRNKFSDTLIATGFPYYDFQRTTKYLRALEQFMKHTRGVRRLGSAALDLAYVACGKFDAFFEYSLSPWDVAGGAILVEEAGGIVCDFKNGDDFIYGQEIMAAQPIIAEEFHKIIQKAFDIQMAS